MQKVKLERSVDKLGRVQGMPWTSCLPFVENSRGKLIHRPRMVSTYKIGERWPSHIGMAYWCGAHVSGQKNFTFLPVPPEGGLLCARCEQMAVVNGFPSAEQLAGRHVHMGKVVAVQLCCEGKQVAADDNEGPG